MTKKSKAEAGAEGGLSRSEPKRRATQANAAKAREAKLRKRLSYTEMIDYYLDGGKDNGNKR